MLACPGGRPLTLMCKRCGTTGRVTPAEAERVADGRRRREDRVARGLSLRQEAERLGLTAEALSDIEHARPYPATKRDEPRGRRTR